MRDTEEPTERQSDPPLKLYRYRSLAGCGMERVIHTLTENKIWFSAPPDFNDPFDCVFREDFDSASTCQKKVACIEYRKRKGDTNRQAKAEAKRLFARPREEIHQWEQERLESFRDRLKNTGILCLSEVPDDILMWSHYADRHKGVCLEFSVGNERHDRFMAEAFEVTYSAAVPVLDFYAGEGLHWVKKTLLTKATHWSYEKERRVIKRGKSGRKGSGLHPIPPGLISAVIFGMRTSQEHRERLRTVLAENELDISFLQARPRRGAYHVDIVPSEPEV